MGKSHKPTHHKGGYKAPNKQMKTDSPSLVLGKMYIEILMRLLAYNYINREIKNDVKVYYKIKSCQILSRSSTTWEETDGTAILEMV